VDDDWKVWSVVNSSERRACAVEDILCNMSHGVLFLKSLLPESCWSFAV
jgi:hypothetical protein